MTFSNLLDTGIVGGSLLTVQRRLKKLERQQNMIIFQFMMKTACFLDAKHELRETRLILISFSL